MNRIASFVLVAVMLAPVAGCFVRTRSNSRCRSDEYWDGRHCRVDRDRHDHDRGRPRPRDHRR
jgi:hypothetical protein